VLRFRSTPPVVDDQASAFRRGWVASTRAIDHDVAGRWPEAAIGRLTLRVHPALGWFSHGDERRAVLFVGDPIDLAARSTSRRRIAARAARELARGVEHAVRYIAYLGGRFTALLWDGATVTVVPDCVGSLPTYYHAAGPGSLLLSSHAHLAGEVARLDVDPAPKRFIDQARAMSTKGTLFAPGIVTPFVGLLPLLPNHALTYDGGEVRHARFYPFDDTVLERDVDAAYARFADAFSTHVALLCGLGRVGVSLTSGLDSRATFAAARPHLGKDALAWTYFKFHAPTDAQRDDLVGANALAARAGVQHRVINIQRPGDRARDAFDDAYARTLRHTPQFAALAAAYHDDLPHGIVELQSMVAEVGTGFYKKRRDDVTPKRLAYLYSSSDFGRLPEVRAEAARFLRHADYSPAALGSLDYHDLYYWELRIGRWGTLRMQEVDLTHHLMLPFNARAVVEALQGPALEHRVEKQALQRYIDEHPV